MATAARMVREPRPEEGRDGRIKLERTSSATQAFVAEEVAFHLAVLLEHAPRSRERLRELLRVYDKGPPAEEMIRKALRRDRESALETRP